MATGSDDHQAIDASRQSGERGPSLDLDPRLIHADRLESEREGIGREVMVADEDQFGTGHGDDDSKSRHAGTGGEIGRASCRERV